MQSMGGGGAMRAAAKVAGIRAVNGGLRGASPAEYTAARPALAIVSSSDELKSSILTASQNNVIDAAGVQRPCWELDDWEFAGSEEDVTVKSSEPMTRVVFGGPPTFQEAKEATSELKDALEKAYLTSPHSAEYEDLMIPGHQYPLSLVSKPEYSETKACVACETEALSVPKNALKAFRLLNESTAVQNVVASIASDPNVWHAVMQNEALTEFLESQKSNMDPGVEESVPEAEFTDTLSQNLGDEFGDSEKSAGSGKGFMGYMYSIKATVNGMLNNLSDYFQSLFGGSAEEKYSDDAGGNAKFTMGASFFGLAAMVIVVMALKRV